MEDEVKTRFEDLDKRLDGTMSAVDDRLDDIGKQLAGTEKRVDDLKWFTTSLFGLFTVAFGVVAVMGGLNFNSERTAIEKRVEEIKSDLLGKRQPQPKIELYTRENKPLQDQEVPAAFEKDDKDGTSKLVVVLIFKNSGDGSSGLMYIKFYLTKRATPVGHQEYRRVRLLHFGRRTST